MHPTDRDPRVGDYIVTHHTAYKGHWCPDAILSVYLIAQVREVKRRKPAERRRFAMRCYRGTKEEFVRFLDDKGDNTFFRIFWYSRNKKKSPIASVTVTDVTVPVAPAS